MSNATTPPRRRGRSPQKRTAIIDAAQTLFLADGYERTSVDAIAARAVVSKRTVYDHFGDKKTVFAAVMDRVVGALLTSVQTAVEQELPDGCDPAPSLLAFARRITTGTFASSDYVLFRKLLASHAAPMPTPNQTQDTPEGLLAERMSSFTRSGALNAPNARRAADHFVALTFLIALDALQEPGGESSDIDELLVDGVNAFLRAYR